MYLAVVLEVWHADMKANLYIQCTWLWYWKYGSIMCSVCYVFFHYVSQVYRLFVLLVLYLIVHYIFIYQLQSGIHMYLVSFWKCKITHSVFRCICTVCEMKKTCHTLPLELCMVYEMKKTCHTLPLELQ